MFLGYIFSCGLGAGYHMVMVKEESCNTEEVTELLKSHVNGLELDSNVGSELSYILPDNQANKFPDMFAELEERHKELHIASYGLSVTTMEEVFIK